MEKCGMRPGSRPAVAMIAGLMIMILAAGCGGGGGDPVLPPGDGSGGQGGGDGGGGDTLLPDCPSGEFLQFSPVPLEALRGITPLGNVEPPAHVFPTDHLYLNLNMDSGSGAAVAADLVSPGDLVVTYAQASEYSGHDFVDYMLNLQPCQDITLVLGHISALDESLFGPGGDFSGWTRGDTYYTGNDTITTWSRQLHLEVQAGQVLGSVGGPTGLFSLDFGLYDQSRAAADMAGRLWTDQFYLYARCPLEYYTPGAERDAMYGLVETGSGSAPPADYCGYLHNDVPGTLQGCWFREGVTDIYPEFRHLAFTPDEYNLDQNLLSIGDEVATIPARDYVVVFNSEGMNDPFAGVTADGLIHSYHPRGAGMEMFILVEMVAADTLWIEGIPADTPQEQWSFSPAKTVFVR